MELNRSSAQLKHRGPDGCGLWIEGPVALACQLFRIAPESSAEIQPAVHSSGAVIVFDGRIDNREELLGDLTGAPAGIADAALALHAYAAWGEGFAEHLNGDFALGLFDPAHQRLLLARDAIGV